MRPGPAGPFRASTAPVGIVLPLVAFVLVALFVAACGATGVSPSARVSPPASASPPASSASSVSPPPSPDAGGPGPAATRWPGGVVEAVMILAKADAEIKAAGADLGAAAASQDLDAMRGAADGLATLLERLGREIPRIAEYPETAPAAGAYAAAFPAMLAGATALRDSITAGDAPGIAAGSRQLAAGLELYAEARRLIGPLADEALLMQRMLVK